MTLLIHIIQERSPLEKEVKECLTAALDIKIPIERIIKVLDSLLMIHPLLTFKGVAIL